MDFFFSNHGDFQKIINQNGNVNYIRIENKHKYGECK
jgi:hypothetical protein